MSFCPRASGDFKAQNMLVRTFELRCRKLADFSSLSYFLAVFKIWASLATVFLFLSLESSFFSNVSYYDLSFIVFSVLRGWSLNSSFIGV